MTQGKMINEMYPLAALFIYANNQEVTKERMAAVLKALGIECQMKLCEFFEMDAIKIKELLTSGGQGSGPTNNAQAGASAAPVAEKKKEEPVVDEELEIDFGFF